MRKAMLLMAVLGFAGSLWAQTPFDGTWKVDMDELMTIVLQNGTYQCSGCFDMDTIKIKADATDQPVQGSKIIDTLAVTLVDEKTIEMTAKKGGKVFQSQKASVSSDGNTVATEATLYPAWSKQPVTMRATGILVSKGPAGSHAYSGSWRMHMELVNGPIITFTYKTSSEGLIMTYRGESYVAKFDGKDYPYKGNPKITSVSLTRENDNSMIENYKRDGKIVQVVHVSVSADGKTLSAKAEDKEKGTTTTSTSIKQ